jgi:hypothetical protein
MAVVYFKILSQHLPGETEENQKKFQDINSLQAEIQDLDPLNIKNKYY